jgi:multiple antibiotic resistance protein
MLEHVLSAFVTIFVTIDPPGLAPVFLALTAGMNRAQRGQVALRAVLTSFGVLLLFAIAGLGILAVFGISLSAFRIAGGVLLFYIAFEMIFEKRQERQEKSAERALTVDQIHAIAIFPLAIPLIAGPGAISAIILLSSHHVGILGRGILIAVVAANLLVAWAVFLLSDRFAHFLGDTGRLVLTRLFGLILAALAVQFVADGVLTLAGKSAS